MLGRRYDVFLSYSRADTERVQPLRDALRGMGYRVFFDVESIGPGSPWKKRLERAIRESRTLVLCWSENTRNSDYISFEYSRAEALHKPVIPWLLDKTPLPAMLEVQALTSPDVGQTAGALRSTLGWTLPQRSRLQWAVAALLIAVLAVAVSSNLRPPPPWEFEGEVTDRVTEMPIQGVQVDVLAGYRVEGTAVTNSEGHYELRLPQPRPSIIQVRFRKAGYQAEQPLNVPTDKPWNMDMAKLP